MSNEALGYTLAGSILLFGFIYHGVDWRKWGAGPSPKNTSEQKDHE